MDELQELQQKLNDAHFNHLAVLLEAEVECPSEYSDDIKEKLYEYGERITDLRSSIADVKFERGM